MSDFDPRADPTYLTQITKPNPGQNLDADPDPDPDPGGGGGGRSAKNVHPPWQNPRYAPEIRIRIIFVSWIRDPYPYYWIRNTLNEFGSGSKLFVVSGYRSCLC